MYQLATGSPFAVQPANSLAVQRMPPIVNQHQLPDMGRMTIRSVSDAALGYFRIPLLAQWPVLGFTR